MNTETIQNFNPFDLIKFLNQEARKNYHENDDNFNAGMSVLIANVKKYFSDDFDIAIRDNNGWISVDDHLPEVGKMVLICTINKESERDITIASFNGLSILHNSHGCNWSGADYYDVVTHWQHLPKPPCTHSN